MAYLGDGATSESDFHVAMNFAAVWKSPVVFLCQNNQWAISVPTSQQTASETIAQKAGAYGMPGVRVDGNNVTEVMEACREAVARARKALESRHLWTEGDEKRLQDAVAAEVSEAVQEAEKSGPPDASTLFEDVFSAKTPALDAQERALAALQGDAARGDGAFPL